MTTLENSKIQEKQKKVRSSVILTRNVHDYHISVYFSVFYI